MEGNWIGTDATGTNALGNGFAGIEFQSGATGNTAGGVAPGAGNVIAFAGGPGVLLYSSTTTNDAIRGNSIFDNGYLGINFNNAGVAANHNGFLAGPNDLQNYPVITNAAGYGVSTIVQGTLNSLPSQNYFVDIYVSPAADPSGYGQGQTYLGTAGVTTDASGNGGFALTNNTGNSAGQYITTTATSAGGDTSEFSLAVMAVNVPVASAQFTGPFQWGANGFSFALSVETNFGYHIQVATNLGANPVVWVNLTNFNATNSLFNITDHTATNYRARFYRVTSP